MPSETYDFTGGWQRFNVPNGVTHVDVDVRGAASGSRRGGTVTGRLAVNDNQVLWILVGREGKANSGKSGGGDAFGGGAAGGDGRGGNDGGFGGGGASAIRLGNYDGAIRAVAGGAGGASGDGGVGGYGGPNNGGNGQRGSAGTGATTNAQGGSQDKGGKGGTSSKGGWYDGQDAPDGRLAQGGVGASANRPETHGGGGGGGGYHSGGGGQGSAPGHTPGGGGGGGSNYHAPLVDADTQQGNGLSGNGKVIITWVAPVPVNIPPPPPTDLQVNGIPLDTETPTRALTSVVVSALLSDSSDRGVRFVVRYSKDSTFATYGSLNTFEIAPGTRHSVTLNVLSPNTLYYVRAWALDDEGLFSVTYAAGSFWTDRPPNPPLLDAPAENEQFNPTDNITFSWTPSDPDDPDATSGWALRWREMARPGRPQPDWNREVAGIGPTAVTIDAPNFRGNTFYQWQAKTRDGNGVWGDWSLSRSFYVLASTTPPLLIEPIRGHAVIAGELTSFLWEFRDPTPGSSQTRADIQYRVVGLPDWIVLYGAPSPGQPGSYREWLIPAGTFIPGYHYEWQARTVDNDLSVSEWSETENFWAIETPGTGAHQVIDIADREIMPELGCGVNRVFVYDRAGEIRRAELTGIESLRYDRKRDDISTADLFLTGYGSDCGELIGSLRSWMHEIVIFRDGVRVWEGPITKIDLQRDKVEIEAKDVMAYAYRRIMRQGYNDSYRQVNGMTKGGLSVVTRARLILMNALAYDDPNVLKWVTTIDHSDDAKQHRAIPDWSRMAWEEIDDMAATAGLDYTTLGRRILLWDTHRPIGRLPELRDGDFSESPRIVEYGMQLANVFGVTNGSGVWGVATRGIVPAPPGTGLTEQALYYGYVEQLASAYGETVGAEPDTLTAEGRASLEQTLDHQADRNIAGRWPTPLVVRVPDGSYLHPNAPVSFDHLVPGVWIPVRASDTVRSVAQWQKLDAVMVTQSASEGERIAVTMSTAPNGGNDPDADSAADS